MIFFCSTHKRIHIILSPIITSEQQHEGHPTPPTFLMSAAIFMLLRVLVGVLDNCALLYVRQNKRGQGDCAIHQQSVCVLYKKIAGNAGNLLRQSTKIS